MSAIHSLPSLNHPNIVNVIAGGKTSPELGGQPFFAMEYVEGLSITKYSEKYKLSVPNRLKLFIQVCEAIEHAHAHEVIHRDIKPSNILVTEKISREPFIKVIDFGIAKAINNGLPVAYATQTGHPIGTPAYMSPEQTGRNPDSVNESSDIYSLGMLLYELLVGCEPINLNRLGQEEQIRTIVEITPIKPSARFNEFTDGEKQRIALCRKIGRSELLVLLRGDLDRIVMKCLEKNREQRFETVGSLATEIQIYLKGNHLTDRIPPSSNRKTHTTLFILVILLVISLGIYLSNPSRKNPHAGSTPVVMPGHPTNSISMRNVSLTNAFPSELLTNDLSTPEGLLTNMIQSFNSGDRDISWMSAHETGVIGKLDWDWLIQKKWFKGKGVGRITGIAKYKNSTEQDLSLLYEYPDGNEQFYVSFFTENGVLKFHDIYLQEMKGDHYDMFLSHFIRDPLTAQAEFIVKNPHKLGQMMSELKEQL